jgi:hypothetical protein
MSILAATTRLREELEELSNVLASGDAASLPAVEERLAMAIDAISNDTQIDDPDRVAVAGVLLGARSALGRCRMLGAGLNHLAYASLAARGQQASYDHLGHTAGRPDLRGVSVNARF